MIPWKLVDRAETKDTGELRLYQRGAEFSIRIDGREVSVESRHTRLYQRYKARP